MRFQAAMMPTLNAVLAFHLAVPGMAWVDYLGSRHLVRSGEVVRWASLHRRRWEDYGVSRGLLWFAAWISCLYSVPAWTFGWPANLLCVLVVVMVVTWIWLADFVLVNMPRLQFQGPPAVSAWLDLRARSRSVEAILYSVIYAPCMIANMVSRDASFERLWMVSMVWFVGLAGITLLIGLVLWRLSRVWRDPVHLQAVMNRALDRGVNAATGSP